MRREVDIGVPGDFLPSYDLLDYPIPIEVCSARLADTTGLTGPFRMMVLHQTDMLDFVPIPRAYANGGLVTRHPFLMIVAQTKGESRKRILVWNHVTGEVAEGFRMEDPSADRLVTLFMMTMGHHGRNVPVPAEGRKGGPIERDAFLVQCEADVLARTGLLVAFMEARHVRPSDRNGALGFVVSEPSDHEETLWRRMSGYRRSPEGMVAITQMGLGLERTDRMDLVLHEVAHVLVDRTVRGMHLGISEPAHGLAWVVACAIMETLFGVQVDGSTYVAKMTGSHELQWWVDRVGDGPYHVHRVQEEVVDFVERRFDRSADIADEVDRLANAIEKEWHTVFDFAGEGSQAATAAEDR